MKFVTKSTANFLVLVFLHFLTDVVSRSAPKPNNNDTLELVVVLFRHGNRTANGPEELYPNDPYLNKDYFPFGIGQLTNAGKRKEFSIGRVLRETFDSFLGPYYYPEIVDARSTDYNRTKMSLQLVLAGLFPPRDIEIWRPYFAWQPVPYNYYPVAQDEVLAGVSCPNYLKEYQKFVKTREYKSDLAPYAQVFQYLTANTGKNITDLEDAYNLYFGLSTEEEYGLRLPEWTKKVWPEMITQLAVKYYFAAMGTTTLRQIGVGYFLQKIIADAEAKIQGKTKGRKIYLYSAHENNVAEFLLVLNIFSPPHIPTYGAHIVLEVHKMDNNAHGIRIYYQDYTSNTKARLLKLPNCEETCEINKFKSLVAKYLPTQGLCGNKKC